MSAVEESPEADSDLMSLDATQLGARLRRGELSCRDLVAETLASIERLDPVLNTFITPIAEEAVAAAGVADDELLRGADRGPMHGLPVGIKDAIDVERVPCTFGARILRERRPERDAAVVVALRRAGAVIVGKQNLHEFAYGVTGENPHFGDTANPWDPERITGGSSSGTAAAVAAGLVPLGLGTDTGGSVRIPAAMCGVVGLKPTFGSVSRDGVLPLAPSLDHVGQLARTVTGCYALFDQIADRPRGLAQSVRRIADDGLGSLRVGIPRQHFFEAIDLDVEDTVRGAIEDLSGLGVRVVDVELPSAVEAQAAATPIMGAEAAMWHAAWMREQPDAYGPDVLDRLRQGARTPALAYLWAQELRARLQAEFRSAFDLADVIVSPTVPLVAPLRGRTFEPRADGVVPRPVINRLTVPANLTGYPAISVCCGRAAGLPVGLQLMGPPDGEATIGGVALAYERATSWHRDRPPVTA